jgi:hypothetical protein
MNAECGKEKTNFETTRLKTVRAIHKCWDLVHKSNSYIWELNGIIAL